MIDALSHLNPLAILAASVAHFVLGGIWFMVLFGRHYAVALGIADRPAAKPGLIFIAGPFLCGLVTIATSAVLLRALGITGYGEALGLGALVGIGYLVPMVVNIAINPLFPRPFTYALINAPYFIIGSLIACLILTAMA